MVNRIRMIFRTSVSILEALILEFCCCKESVISCQIKGHASKTICQMNKSQNEVSKVHKPSHKAHDFWQFSFIQSLLQDSAENRAHSLVLSSQMANKKWKFLLNFGPDLCRFSVLVLVSLCVCVFSFFLFLVVSCLIIISVFQTVLQFAKSIEKFFSILSQSVTHFIKF